MSKLLILLFFLGTATSVAQVQQNSKLVIKDNSVVSIKTGPYNFGADVESTRTLASNGKLLFLAGVTTAGTTDANNVNGFASSRGNANFTFPIGDANVYRPLRIDGATAATKYNALYNAVDPITVFTSSTLQAGLEAISNVEYWDLDQGAPSAPLTVYLTYGTASNADQLSAVVDNLVVAGYNASSNTWDALPSFFDSGDINAGTIGATNVDLEIYSKFTLGAKLPCFDVETNSGPAITWNGTIFSGATSINNVLTLSNDLDLSLTPATTLLEAFALDLNGNTLTLGDNQTLRVYGDITDSDTVNPGKIVLDSSSASVVQIVGGAGPAIELTKEATAMKAYDYIYLGAPLAGGGYNFATMASEALDINGVPIPATANAVFDLYYSYRNGFAGTGSPWTATSIAPGNGEGIIARIAPRAPFSSSTAEADVRFTFNGQANNGDVVIANPEVNLDPLSNTSNILLGNPYPSAIDGVAFLKENAGVDGVLYVWQTNVASGTGGTYSGNDYLAFTLAGTIAPTGLSTFNGIIPTGQGFKVRVTDDTEVLKFDNCMRVTGNNDQFFKTAGQPIDRFKVNMTGANGVFNQMLVAYMPEGTLGYDRMYDARSFSTSTARLYTFDNASTKLSINARPNFNDTDVVPVGFAKSNTNSETFTLSLAEQEGIFTTPNVTVYLHDRVLNTYHNLSAANYTLTTNQAAIENRFEIVYQNGTLSNDDLEEAVTTISLIDTAFNLDSSNVVKEVQIFDLAGRLIQNYANINASSFNAYFNHAEGVYIAKVTYDNGSLGSVKLIHSK